MDESRYNDGEKRRADQRLERLLRKDARTLAITELPLSPEPLAL